MNSTAHTNSGIAVADRPPTEMTRSRAVPSCSAAITPPKIASGTTMTKASSASLAEATSGLKMTSLTGRSPWTDVPRSPVTKLEIQSQYCVISGRSVPSLLVERVDRPLIGERTEHAPPHVARQHLGGEEDDDAQHEQRDQAERDAFQR